MSLMGTGWPGDLTPEWWDTLDAGEHILTESSERPIVEELSCSWADHQESDCMTLFPISFSADGSPQDNPESAFSTTTTASVEEMFSASCFLGSPPGSPLRFAFKDSFTNRSPSAQSGHQDERAASASPTPTKLSSDSGHEAQQQSIPTAEAAVDLQLAISIADEGSESVTCIIVGGWSDATGRSNSCCGGAQAGSSSSKPAADESMLPLDVDCLDGPLHSETREDEGDSSLLGYCTEVDLQCKGEQLGLDGDEDSSGDTNIDWIHPAAEGVLGFIPVSNGMPEVSSFSFHGPTVARAAPRWGSEDSAGETDERCLSQSEGKAAEAPETSPEPSGLESAISDETTAFEWEGKRRQGMLAEAASVNDITAAGAAQANRRRVGRPSKPTPAASEAKAAATKRKRATTSKPAAPATSGQACTQCFTHVTPVWRAGPEGPKTLCNACGVRYMKVAKRK